MEGELAGARYLYCGFDADLRMHLIYHIDEEYSEGLLLDDRTGRTLPAGELVAFAPDKTKYFISRQPDGFDGKEWRVYSRGGKLLWKGVSGIEAYPHAREGRLALASCGGLPEGVAATITARLR